jgi:hypothetical protein
LILTSAILLSNLDFKFKLRRYSMGIHTLSEGETYDAEKRRRVAECARLKVSTCSNLEFLGLGYRVPLWAAAC